MTKKIFHTTQSDLLEYDGDIVQVLGELDENEYDKADVGTMFNILASDGKRLQAFEDELTDLDEEGFVPGVEFLPIGENDRTHIGSSKALDDMTKVVVTDNMGHVGYCFVENRDIELFGQEYIRSHVSLIYSQPLKDWFVRIDRDSYINDINHNPLRPIRLEFVEIERGTGREVYRGIINRNYYLRESHPAQEFAEWAVCGKRRKEDDGASPRANTIFLYGNQKEQVTSRDNRIAAWEGTFNKDFSKGILSS